MTSRFRNLILAPILGAAVLSSLLSGCVTGWSGADSGWVHLFDGSDFSRLRGYNQPNFPADFWIIDDGALKTVPGRAVDLVTREEYEDFDLQFEWKLTPGGNSGVMYNASETSGPVWHTGPEYQLLDDDRHPDGRNVLTSAGALYGLKAPMGKTLKPVGQYNTSRIVAKDGQVEHWLNGVKVVEYTWGSPEIAALIQRSKFKDLPAFMKKSSGLISFQHHGEEAWLRNIRIKRL